MPGPFGGLVADDSEGGGVLPGVDIQLAQFINSVRLYTRDYRELNRLLGGEESSPRQMIHAVFDALDDFNSTPPFTRFTLGNFPSKSLLLRGTVITLLESVGLLMTRNELAFNDGGMSVPVNNKTPYIQAWLQLFKNSYEEKKNRIKQAYNIENAWGGGLGSEYNWISNFYGAW